MSKPSNAPILKGSWSDAEKLALLVSMIKSTGAPKWSNGIAVPAGRTLQASAKMYSEILKASASVPMTAGDAVTPSGKRPRNGNGNSKDFDNDDNVGGPSSKKRKTTSSTKPRGSKKGGKKPNVAEAIEGGDDDSEEGFEEEADEEKTIVKMEVKKEEEEGLHDAV